MEKTKYYQDRKGFRPNMIEKLKDTRVIVIIIIVAIIFFFLGSFYRAYKIRNEFIKGFKDLGFSQNNVSNSVNKGTTKQYIEVKKGESYTYGNGIKLNINKYENVGKTFKEESFGTRHTAQKSFLVIYIIGENTGREPAFKSMSNAKLKLADGTTYNNYHSVQMPSGYYEGMGGCFECESNPGEKDVQGLLFDISEDIDINGAKVIIDGVEFLL